MPPLQGIEQRTSRRGNCRDDAVVEWGPRSLKHEWVGDRASRDYTEAKRDVLQYLWSFYNQRRWHAAIGHRRPAVIDALAS